MSLLLLLLLLLLLFRFRKQLQEKLLNSTVDELGEAVQEFYTVRITRGMGARGVVLACGGTGWG